MLEGRAAAEERVTEDEAPTRRVDIRSTGDLGESLDESLDESAGGHPIDRGDPTVDTGRPTSPLAAAAPHGTRLGRYLILERLGAGGMGEVLLAFDPELDRRVAIKVLRPRRAKEPVREEDSLSWGTRLIAEARALAKLSHPNVVAVHDVGTTRAGEAGGEAGHVYVAMEYIDGKRLDRWLRERHDWREIASLLHSAGAGLAAAHREGIVHRDFKPGNVMVGSDGRVRVLDFGLARRLDDPIPLSSDPASLSGEHDLIERGLSPDVSNPLTETGLVLGTPAYMAPEQFTAGTIDARTDQFAFCIVLYEALYGQRPFSGKGYRKLSDAVLAGEVREAENYMRAPARLRTLVHRGLQVDPEARFPDMDALLAELDRCRRPPPWRRWGLGVLAVGGVVAISTASLWREQPCTGARDEIAKTWDDAERDAVVQSLRGTGVAYAADVADRVVAQLDAYTDEWAQAHEDACRDTRVRGEQAEAFMDLRMACLDERRMQLEAFVELAAQADEEFVRGAVQATAKLAPLNLCADRRYLEAGVRPPSDPEQAEEVGELRARLARGRAAALTGRYQDALELGHSVLDGARAIEYGPLVAESATLVAQSLERLGRIDEALPIYTDALTAAAAAGHERAEAWILAGLVGHFAHFLNDPEVAARYAAHTQGVLEHLGNPVDIRMQLLVFVANGNMKNGHYDEALAKYREAIEVALGHPSVQQQRHAAMVNIGVAYGSQGDHVQAAQALGEALEATRHALGERHPSTGTAMGNYGAALNRIGERERGGELLLQATKVLSEAFPDGHPELALALNNLANYHQKGGDLAQAEAMYLRALQMKRRSLGETHTSVAHTLNNLGDLMRDLGELDRAREYLTQALQIWESELGPDHPFIAFALVGLGEVEVDAGRPNVALPLLERGVGLRETAGKAGAERGEARLWLARALHATGGERSRVRTLLADARADYVEDPQEQAAALAEIDAFETSLDDDNDGDDNDDDEAVTPSSAPP